MAAGIPARGRAQLLVSTDVATAWQAAHTDLTPLLSDRDDGVVVRAFARPFTFYGRAQDALALTTNGYVQLGGDPWYVRSAARSLPELAAALGAGVVAPLYDDLLLDGEAAIVEDVVADHFQAYTYRDVRGFGDTDDGSPVGRSTFQVTFFTGATRIGGVDFGAGDVAFSYGGLAHRPAADGITAGLAADATTYTAPTGARDAMGTFDGPWALGAGGTVHFRATAAGGYEAIADAAPGTAPPVTTTPEPPAVLCIGAGLALTGAIARRRRASSRAG